MNPTDLRTARSDREALLAELSAAGADVRRPNSIRCPFHDDRHASAGVYRDEAGVWRFRCHAGGCGFAGDLFDVRAKASGRELGDVLSGGSAPTLPPRRREPDKPPKVWAPGEFERVLGEDMEARYDYTDPDTGRIDLIVFRIRVPGGGKRFMQAHPVDGGIVLKAPAGPLPIYNRRRVRDASAVVVVEGEKVVDGLHQLRIVATTSPGGAGSAGRADWTPLAGKRLYLWPDCDPPDEHGKRPGIDHMRDVAEIVTRLRPPCDVRWIDPDALGLPPKADALDYIASLGDGVDTAEARGCVLGVLSDAVPIGDPAEGVRRLIRQTIDGTRTAIPWPWPMVGNLTKSLLPGTVTLLCGDPGATKSFLLLQAAMFWHRAGHHVALYELEETAGYHLYRALAQLEGDARLFDDEWVRAHPADAEAAMERHGDTLRDFGRCIDAAPTRQATLEGLARWVAARVAEGAELVCIDPITAAEATDKPWVADQKFIVAVRSILRDTAARLVLVTHPRKGRKNAVGLDELAGGAAYARLAQTVLWLETHHPPRRLRVTTPLGPDDVAANRSLRIVKCRNGRGAGCRLAYRFDGATLLLDELGLVEPKRRSNDDE